MKELGIQLWSVRHALKDTYEGILDRIVEFGYRTVQPAGYPGTTVEQAAAWYRERGLSVRSVHSALPVGQDRDRVVHETQALGCRDVIVSRGQEQFKTIDSVRRVCDELNEAAESAAKAGLDIGYHNHWWEFSELVGSDKTGYDILVEHCSPSVFFELDAYWTLVGGADPVAVIESLGERCRYLHVKDGAGVRDEPNAAIGQGIMGWPAVMTAARRTDTLYVEFDRCDGDLLAAVKASAEYLIPLIDCGARNTK